VQARKQLFHYLLSSGQQRVCVASLRDTTPWLRYPDDRVALNHHHRPVPVREHPSGYQPSHPTAEHDGAFSKVFAHCRNASSVMSELPPSLAVRHGVVGNRSPVPARPLRVADAWRSRTFENADFWTVAVGRPDDA
jgi:hypothetical protein